MFLLGSAFFIVDRSISRTLRLLGRCCDSFRVYTFDKTASTRHELGGRREGAMAGTRWNRHGVDRASLLRRSIDEYGPLPCWYVDGCFSLVWNNTVIVSPTRRISSLTDPHRGNLLKTPDGKLALIDFGMVVDIDEDFRYSLFGLVIGLQNKDIPLVTENLLKLGFLKDTTQLDILIPRLRAAVKNATGGTGKTSDINFAQLQAELDEISRENILRFSTPAFFTVIIRSLTILEGVALSVDKNFRLVRGAYPYVLRQLLNPEDSERQPEALQRLLVRLLTVDGEGQEIEWERLRDFLRLAQKASKAYVPSSPENDSVSEDKATISRKTLELFGLFLTSRTGIFLKKPLVHVSANDSSCSLWSLLSHCSLWHIACRNWRKLSTEWQVLERRTCSVFQMDSFQCCPEATDQ